MNAANLYVFLAINTPVISGFALSLLSSGSRERTKIMGERGHLWRVTLDIEKAFNRWPLTRTFAVSEEYSATIKFSIHSRSSRATSVSDM